MNKNFVIRMVAVTFALMLAWIGFGMNTDIDTANATPKIYCSYEAAKLKDGYLYGSPLDAKAKVKLPAGAVVILYDWDIKVKKVKGGSEYWAEVLYDGRHYFIKKTKYTLTWIDQPYNSKQKATETLVLETQSGKSVAVIQKGKWYHVVYDEYGNKKGYFQGAVGRIRKKK